MAEYFAIAITRTCGSGGGSYIGKKLAADYGIDLYDRKLLRLASEDSGINEKIFADADENTKKTFLYRAQPEDLQRGDDSAGKGKFCVGSEPVQLPGKSVKAASGDGVLRVRGQGSGFCAAG